MITSQNKLEIFERFITDYTLPKHFTPPVQTMAQTSSSGWNEGIILNTTPSGFNPSNFIASTDSTGSNESKDFKKSRNLFKKISDLFKRLKNPKISATKVFQIILNNKEELVQFEERAQAYRKLIENAQKIGQIAFVEKLKQAEFVNNFESQLFALSYKKFISEENLIKVVSKCEKGLRLDWIKNFIRIIPEQVINTKLKIDKLKIFDNYVILHYDPNNKGFEKTNKEKDPILFGVIRESRKLYFVADWVDEFCDLTFDKLLQHFSETEKSQLEIQKDKFDV